jgi:hypothetical protein
MADNVYLSAKRDKPLFEKLKAIARLEHLPVNTLAKQILHKRTDQLVTELGIQISTTQPVDG